MISYIPLYYGEQHQILGTTGKYFTLGVEFDAKVILEFLQENVEKII
jgi:hypothetical protein